jgi:hypothetical protein
MSQERAVTADRAAGPVFGEVVLGVLSSEGLAKEIVEQLREELPEQLDQRFPDVTWRVKTGDEPLAGTATTSTELVRAVDRRRRGEGWDLGICLTDLPLSAGSRPVTAQASPTHRVGLISVPAFGAVDVEGRVQEAVLQLLEGLLAESATQADGNAGGDDREERMGRRLQELSFPLGTPRVKDEGTVRFVTAVARGNLRLLTGMVRANRPSRLIARLSRSLASALGTAALALVSVNVWLLADGSGWVRLALVACGAVVFTCAALIVAHHLWEHSSGPGDREQVVLFNAASTITLALGVLSLYAALFVLSAVCAGALIPTGVFEHNIGHPVGVGNYLRLVWLVASLATIGGALGSFVESDGAVREAAYRYHLDERIEANG